MIVLAMTQSYFSHSMPKFHSNLKQKMMLNRHTLPRRLCLKHQSFSRRLITSSRKNFQYNYPVKKCSNGATSAGELWTIVGVIGGGGLSLLTFNTSNTYFGTLNGVFDDTCASNVVKCETPPSSNRCDINVTDVEADLIARNLKNMVDIPGIPDAIEKPVLEQIIKAFIKVCPLVLPEGVFNKLVSGEAEVEGLSEAVIRQISNEIYIPLIPKEVQNEIVESLCRVFFTSNNFAAIRHNMVSRSLKAMIQDESRLTLATELNELVDIPILSEDQEQFIAEKLVNACFDVFEMFIPAPIKKILNSTRPEDLKDIRNNLVDRLNEKINLPWVSEEEEKKAFRYIVDFFLSFYGLQEGTKNPDEALDDVKHELKIAQIELEAHRENSYDKEQRLLAKISLLEEKEKTLHREVHGNKSWLGFLRSWKRN